MSRSFLFGIDEKGFGIESMIAVDECLFSLVCGHAFLFISCIPPRSAVEIDASLFSPHGTLRTVEPYEAGGDSSRIVDVYLVRSLFLFLSEVTRGEGRLGKGHCVCRNACENEVAADLLCVRPEARSRRQRPSGHSRIRESSCANRRDSVNVAQRRQEIGA